MDEEKPIGRRAVLKMIGLAGGLLGAGGAVKLSLEHREREQESRVAVLDIFGLENDADAQFPEDQLLESEPRTQNEAAQLMTRAVKGEYKDHGKVVMRVFQTMGRDITHDTTQLSITEAIILNQTKFDYLGNPTISFEIPKEKIVNMVRKTNAGVINMSFEPGKQEATYRWKKETQKYPEILRSLSTVTIGDVTTYLIDGQDVTKEEYEAVSLKAQEKEVVELLPIDRQLVFIDGYAGKETLNNLMALIDIASRFPEKTFVAAGGNPTWFNGAHIPDIRDARKILSNKSLWPDNLVVVGFEGRENGVEGPACLGADIYVNWKDLKNLGFNQASSFATPVISELISKLKEKGENNWREVLLRQLTHKEEFYRGDEKIEYPVLDLAAAKEKIK